MAERAFNLTSDPSTGVEVVRTAGPLSLRLPPPPVQVVQADSSTPDSSTPGYYDGSVLTYDTTNGNGVEREKCWIYPVEAATGAAGPTGPSADVVVKVTSATTTSGMYPGTIQTVNNESGNPATWNTGAICWVIGDNAETLTSGTRYNAIFQKIHAADGRSVFSVSPSSLEVVDAETTFVVSGVDNITIGWGYVSSTGAGIANILYSAQEGASTSGSPTSIPSGSTTPINFAIGILGAQFQSNDFALVQDGNLAHITVPANGLYEVGCNVTWNAHTGGSFRELQLYSGIPPAAITATGFGDTAVPLTTSRAQFQGFSAALAVPVGTVFQINALQDSGGVMSISQGIFWVRKVG